MFKGTTSIYEYTTSEIIGLNIKYWLDQSFLNIDGYFEAKDKFKNLFHIPDKRYANGRVWKTEKNNLIWEDSNLRPTNLLVNGTPSNDYQVDYTKNRIIFNNSINSKSNVSLDYFYKWIYIASADEVDWMNEIVGASLDVEPNKEMYIENQIQLPAIIFEHTERYLKPYQLGLGMKSKGSIVFHIFAQSGSEVNRIADILSEQTDQEILIFNPDLIKTNNTYPLLVDGSLNPNGLNYNDLIKYPEDGGYAYSKMFMYNSLKQSREKLSNNLYHLPVRIDIEFNIPNI